MRPLSHSMCEHCMWSHSPLNFIFSSQSLEQPHQLMQTFRLFCINKLLFLFYTPIFTKHPHQSIYSTHLFNKIFILLQFFYYFLTHNPSLSHIPNTTKKKKKKNVKCTSYSNHAYMHGYCSTCAFMHNFTHTDVSVFFCQNMHISTPFLFCTY